MPLCVHVMSNVHTSMHECLYVLAIFIQTDAVTYCWPVIPCSPAPRSCSLSMSSECATKTNFPDFKFHPLLLRLQFAIHSLIDIESSWPGHMHLWWINSFFHILTPDDTVMWQAVKVFLGLNWKATGNCECQRLMTQWLGETQWHAAPRFEFGRLVTLSGGDWWHFE